MRYYRQTVNGYIVAVGTGLGGEEITRDAYDGIIGIIADRPAETAGTGYRLREDLTWESYARDPEPEEEAELTAEEIAAAIQEALS